MKGGRIWATGLGVALLAWPVGFATPASGLDLSWMGGLYLAVHDGKHFGNEIVFTYGPLGFLAWPGLWFSWLAVLAYAYSAAVYLAFSITFVWLLERSIGLAAAAVVTFLYLVTVPDLEQVPLLLAVGWSFAALRADRPPAAVTWLAVGGGILSAIEPLVKLSVGPATLLICVLGLAGARASRRQWLLFAAIAGGGLLSLWLVSGQALDQLWNYALNEAQIVSGYNEAMGVDLAPIWQAIFLGGFALGLVAAVNRASFRDARSRWFASGLTAVAAFVLFKYGTTRFFPIVVALAASGMVGIFLMAPWPRQRFLAYLAAGATLGAITFHISALPPRLDVVGNLKGLADSAELAIRPGLRQERIDEARVNLQAALALPPKALAAIRDKQVAIDPWESSIAWAYELDWSPLPVFQSYSAYTSRLDRLNAAAVEAPGGPQVILRADTEGPGAPGPSGSFEGRVAAWDPPEQNLATVCNFHPTVTEGSWQVLSRIPDRCREPQLISSVSAQQGETVRVPQAGRGQLVVLRLKGIGIEGLERLRLLVWRPRPRSATINDGEVTVRLVPGTAEDGMIVSRDPALDGEGAFAQLPEVRSMSVEGVDRQLRFDFYRVRVTPSGVAR
jgi:hypothetical protein